MLLNQFHDVLPGSGIGIIYPQAEQYYQEAIDTALSVWTKAGDAIFGKKSFRQFFYQSTGFAFQSDHTNLTKLSILTEDAPLSYMVN